MPIPKLDRPIYAAYDLGGLDPALAGVTINVLQNPTIRFRAGFRVASLNPEAPEWSEYVAAILGVEPDTLMDAIGDLEQSVAQALFATTFESFDAKEKSFIGEDPARVMGIWDAYAETKRKGYGVR